MAMPRPNTFKYDEWAKRYRMAHGNRPLPHEYRKNLALLERIQRIRINNELCRHKPSVADYIAVGCQQRVMGSLKLRLALRSTRLIRESRRSSAHSRWWRDRWNRKPCADGEVPDYQDGCHPRPEPRFHWAGMARHAESFRSHKKCDLFANS